MEEREIQGRCSRRGITPQTTREHLTSGSTLVPSLPGSFRPVSDGHAGKQRSEQLRAALTIDGGSRPGRCNVALGRPN